jgi:hypothetical protein
MTLSDVLSTAKRIKQRIPMAEDQLSQVYLHVYFPVYAFVAYIRP